MYMIDDHDRGCLLAAYKCCVPWSDLRPVLYLHKLKI